MFLIFVFILFYLKKKMATDKIKLEYYEAFLYYDLDCDYMLDVNGAKAAARALG